ncbi:hypothetical protein ACWD33_01425 [Streptomyces xiamenensis]
MAWTAPGGGGGLEDALGRWFGPAGPVNAARN